MLENFAFTSYCVDINIWGELKKSIEKYNKILIVTGEKSFVAVKENLLNALGDKYFEIKKYQGECTYEHADEIYKSSLENNFDLVLGAGGGKAIDTAKIVAWKMKKDIFIVPTIASTCAGTSALSVVYNSDSTLKEFCFYDAPPKKIFIDLETIKNSPSKYIWAGMGDTLAKFYEVRIKHEYMISKNLPVNFPSAMGVKLSSLCRDLIVETKFENGFQIVKEDLEKAITEKTKAIIVNSPSNPTGVCYNIESLNIIREFAIEHDILVIADDVYDFFSYEKEFIPITTLPDMKKRTVTICSFSKNFAMTGWRIGYVFADPEIIDCINFINESIVYSACSVSQRCALYALKDFKRLKKNIVPIFKERVEYCYNRIKNIDFLDCFKAKGGIYLFINIKKTGMTSQEFTDYLLENYNILVVNGDTFGVKGFVRIACTLDIKILKEAFDRIEKIKF